MFNDLVEELMKKLYDLDLSYGTDKEIAEKAVKQAIEKAYKFGLKIGRV